MWTPPALPTGFEHLKLGHVRNCESLKSELRKVLIWVLELKVSLLPHSNVVGGSSFVVRCCVGGGHHQQTLQGAFVNESQSLMLILIVPCLVSDHG
jgi:hypothetical protein